MKDLDEILIDLQTRIAFQEDTLLHLNDVIAKQDSNIIQLQRQLHLLTKQFQESLNRPNDENSNNVVERPPHY